MLNAVLTKLIACMNAYNQYVLMGSPVVATHSLSKCQLLIECLEAAGYKITVKTKRVVVSKGTYKGCCGNMYTDIRFDANNIAVDDLETFTEVGFVWLQRNNIMRYEFEMHEEDVCAI